MSATDVRDRRLLSKKTGGSVTRGTYLALHLVPAALLVAALAYWPYGYYTLLRFIVCIAAVWLAVLDFQRNDKITPWVIVLGIIAILFNPIAPVYLSRGTWAYLDVAAAILFGIHAYMASERKVV